VQVHTRPPTFAVFLTGSSPVDPPFERYLGDKVRLALGLYGVPLRFWFRYGGHPPGRACPQGTRTWRQEQDSFLWCALAYHMLL
jgi:hypothetical protein